MSDTAVTIPIPQSSDIRTYYFSWRITRSLVHHFEHTNVRHIREYLSRTGIFHVLFALIFLTLMIIIFQDLILSTSPHSFQTISSAHFVQQVNENMCIETHDVANTMLSGTWYFSNFFLHIFMTFRLFYLLHILSISFTLHRKRNKTHAIDPMK